MAPLTSCITLQYFVMICFTINIVHVANADNYTECMRQISLAYGKHKTSTGCFRHAVQYYIKGDRIPIESSFIPIPDKSPNISNQSQKVANQGQNVSNENKNGASSSRRALKPRVTVHNFNDLMSANELADDSFEEISNEEQIPEDQSDELQNVSTGEQSDDNYAELYYKQLEIMVQAGGLRTPLIYCRDFHFDFYNMCIESLVNFGTTAKEASDTALTVYRLADCVNYFIYSFMKYIIDNINITRPSKRPQTFCNDICNQERIWIRTLQSL